MHASAGGCWLYGALALGCECACASLLLSLDGGCLLFEVGDGLGRSSEESDLELWGGEGEDVGEGLRREWSFLHSRLGRNEELLVCGWNVQGCFDKVGKLLESG